MEHNEDASPRVSVVVPAYCEGRRIERGLRELYAWLDGNLPDYEVVVVDDGSTDDTADVVRGLAAELGRIRLVSYTPNRGKGYAVRTGLAAARGKAVVFTDADLSTPPAEIARALELLESADVVAGSRASESSRLLVRQGPVREGMGRAFNRIARMLGVAFLSDTQCGFKAFRADVLPILLPRLRTDGFAFDVELLLEASRAGLRIVEQPVEWRNDPNSRVRVVSDSLAMLVELLRIAVQKRLRRAGRRAIDATSPRR